jgi:phosphoserine phosphatase
LIDLDGTLLEGPSAERAFVAELWRCRLLGPRQIATGFAFFPRWGWRYGWLTPGMNKAYLAGLTVDGVAQRAERFALKYLLKHLRASVLERLNAHQGAGEPALLLTGAPDFLVRPLARSLGAAAFSATVCAQKNGLFTADPPTLYPFGRQKLAQARELCAQFGYDISQCIAYADAIYDLPLLREVAKAIVVHPDRRLRRAAEKAGWEILEN